MVGYFHIYGWLKQLWLYIYHNYFCYIITMVGYTVTMVGYTVTIVGYILTMVYYTVTLCWYWMTWDRDRLDRE